MIIQYYKKIVYGKQHLYVSKPEEALNFELITGRKTLLPTDLGLFGTLGVKFKEVLSPNQ